MAAEEASFSRWPWWRRWFGRRSERAAARFLRGLGYRVVAANVSDPAGEIDLIALDGQTVVVVEVRSTESDDLERPLWDIARSAADLLTSGDHDRIKECASTTCEWVFLDRSRNRSRRWCDMSDCGNRAKARRFHAKKQTARV